MFRGPALSRLQSCGLLQGRESWVDKQRLATCRELLLVSLCAEQPQGLYLVLD